MNKRRNGRISGANKFTPKLLLIFPVHLLGRNTFVNLSVIKVAQISIASVELKEILRGS